MNIVLALALTLVACVWLKYLGISEKSFECDITQLKISGCVCLSLTYWEYGQADQCRETYMHRRSYLLAMFLVRVLPKDTK